MDINRAGRQPAYAKSELNYAKFLKNILIGALIGLFATLALIFLLSFAILTAAPDPNAFSDAATVAAAGLGGLIGGFIAARRGRSHYLFHGLTAGFAICLILLFIMMLAPQNEEGVSFGLRLAILLCQAGFAGLGGVIAGNTGGKRRSKGRYGRRG